MKATYRRKMGSQEIVLTKSEEDICFADATVANYEDLCEIVVSYVLSHFDFNNRNNYKGTLTETLLYTKSFQH